MLTSPATAWVAAAIGAWLVAGACRSMETPAPSSPHALPSPSAEGLVEAPSVRVGILPDAVEVTIGAPSGVRVLALSEGHAKPHWRPMPQVSFDPSEKPGHVRMRETGEELPLATIVPTEADEILSVDGRPYRGILEVRPSRSGQLTVVNVVHLEDYLRGVVANELSPSAFPLIEAHKAQAVAARTWVLAHLGDYSSKGYDVCATQACQVYRGQATEHWLTDRAVEETRGVIATWRTRPIHAYYTSTCGGHTEDGDAIFDDRAPYLRGVVCSPESTARHALRTEAELRRDLPGSASVARSLALLESLNVVDGTLADPQMLAGVPGDAEIRGWMGSLQLGLGRAACASPVTGGLGRRATLAEFAVASVCWAERAAPRGEGEDDPLAALSDGAELVGDGERQAAALLLREGLLTPDDAGALNPDATVTRGEVLDLFAGLAEKAGALEWRSGEFAGLADGQLTLLQGETADRFSLDTEARLFQRLGNVFAGTRKLTLRVGDEVGFVARGDKVVYLEAHLTPEQAAFDGASRHYHWEKHLTPADVARKVARYGQVGEVQDLVPRKLGVSGRVVELEVKGTTGDLLLKGLKVRWGLGLRENLFVIDRQVAEDGALDRFVISGKGWGHGVGLCQVGAFGMAQGGASFEDILRHYYTGIRLADTVEHPTDADQKIS